MRKMGSTPRLIHVGPHKTPCVIADGLPTTGWSLHSKGYVIYTSRKIGGLRRGISAHRAAIELLTGERLATEKHVHHQRTKRDNAPGDLIVLPEAMNPGNGLRCPFTGQFMSAAQWERRFGITKNYS
jgi:hypothetical protein